MAESMTTHIVDLERDERGWWVASVRNVAGCHTQGRSIHQAMARAREALEACSDVAKDADLTPSVRLPAEARSAIDRYEAARLLLEQTGEDARIAAATAVEVLTGSLGLSTRDAAELLGLSHQRVHQVTRAR